MTIQHRVVNNRVYTQVAHVVTSAGKMYLRDTGGQGKVVVCIHGNSTSGKIYKEFVKSLRRNTGDDYRCLVLDLPGHGKSSDATRPQEVYSLYGYASAVTEVLRDCKVTQANFVGHSLGGHIVTHLMAQAPADIKIQSAILIGTPPLAADPTSIGAAFNPNDAMGLTGKATNFTKEEAETYLGAHGIQAPNYPKLVQTAMRTDGKARGLMMQSIVEGKRCDEVGTLSRANVPVLLLNGANDSFVNMRYIAGLNLGNNGSQIQIQNEGHAPMITQPERVAGLVERFILNGHALRAAL